MAIDTEEFVYSFIEARPAPTEAEYFDKIREMHKASVAIENCSLEYEVFKLVRVDTSEATKVKCPVGGMYLVDDRRLTCYECIVHSCAIYVYVVAFSSHLQVLRSKALDIRNALLEALVAQAREQNTDIIAQYEAILTRIAEKPANEAELAALREFISDATGQVHPSALH